MLFPAQASVPSESVGSSRGKVSPAHGEMLSCSALLQEGQDGQKNQCICPSPGVQPVTRQALRSEPGQR